MKQRALIIINPRSGDGEAKRWLFDMADAFLKRFEYVTVYLSKCAGDIARVAKEEAGKYDAILCCGGDGTLHETICGIHASGKDPMLGYIPAGTVNDFATSHGIPKSFRGAIDKIAGGTPRAYDVGLLGNDPFVYVAAFGAFTDVAYLTPQQKKNAFGKTAYFTEGMKRISSLAPIRAEIETENGMLTGEFLLGMATNSKTVGGFRFFDGNTEEDLRDGMLELLLIRYPKSPQQLQEAIFGLLNPKMQTDTILRTRGRSFSFFFPDGTTPWTMDGEFGGDRERVTVSCLHERIRVME